MKTATALLVAVLLVSMTLMGGCQFGNKPTDTQTPAAPAAGAPPVGGPAGPATGAPAITPTTPGPATTTDKLPIVTNPDGSKSVGDVTRFSLSGDTVVRSKPTYVGTEETWRSYPVLRSATMADQFMEILAKWQARNTATPDDATEFELTVRSSDGQQMYAYLIDAEIRMAIKDSDEKYRDPQVIATIVGNNKPTEVFATFKAELIGERNDMRARRKANITRMQEAGEIPGNPS